jgi:hypothetical protein
VNFQAPYNKFLGAAWCSKGKPEATSECDGVKRNFKTDRKLMTVHSTAHTQRLTHAYLSIK